MVIFQHMIGWGKNYSPETLARLTEIDAIVAVNASTGDYQLYEHELLALRTAPRRISILASSDVLLFPYFALGHADGTLVSLAILGAPLGGRVRRRLWPPPAPSGSGSIR